MSHPSPHSSTEAIESLTGQGGLPFFRLHCGGAVAEIYSHGAHLTHFQPADHEPVIFMSPLSPFAAGKAIRGGVPVCAPWFGDHPTDKNAPAHGLVRAALWSPICTQTNPGSTGITFEIQSDGGSGWPSPFTLRMDVELRRDTLTMELRFTNRGDEVCEYTNALHSYFVVSDVTKVAVRGLQGHDYLDKTENYTRHTENADALKLTGRTDRIYLNATGDCVIEDPGMNRTIHVSKSGSHSTVVWNPWDALAATMGDLGAENWPGFLCVESANADSDRLPILPGESHTLKMKLAVTRNGPA